MTESPRLPGGDGRLPASDDARRLGRRLLDEARHGALAVIDPGDGTPVVSRIAVATTPGGAPLSLVSGLSGHTRALGCNPACALLVGEPADRGDPLVHPRMTIHAVAHFLPRQNPDFAGMATHYLSIHPRAGLYLGLQDFVFVIFGVRKLFLNGGPGRAWMLSPGDIGLEPA